MENNVNLSKDLEIMIKIYNMNHGWFSDLEKEIPEKIIDELLSIGFIHVGYSRTAKTWGINKILEDYLSELELIKKA